MSLREKLLSRGYFPENLPPVFNSVQFAELVCNTLKLTSYIAKDKSATRGAGYNSTKRGQQRRHFTIPNPIAAADTALFLETWEEKINTFLQSSKFSISTPEQQEEGRAVKITPHSEIPLKKTLKLSSSRFIVKTDISRFYPSIYTHSLPWAFHGKEKSKMDRSQASTSVFFNRLDHILRQGQDGQTVGIPIGSDSSRIIAEILAVAIDKAFFKKAKNVPMLRHVDDVWIGASTYEDAQRLLNIYRSCLREFELDINELKTFIVKTTDDLSETWPSELTLILQEHFTPESRDIDKLSAIDAIFSFANKMSDDGVVRYGISKLDDLNAWDDNWELLESFLFRCTLHYPHTIDYVAKVLAWRVRRDQAVNKATWRKVINDFVLYHSSNGNDSEVCWGLWLALELSLKISNPTPISIAENCGSLPIIMLFGCADKKLLDAEDLGKLLIKKFGENPFCNSFWIAAYECFKRKWVSFPSKLTYPKIFESMINADVSFCDFEAPPPVFKDLDMNQWSEVTKAIDHSSGSYEVDPEDEFGDITVEEELPF